MNGKQELILLLILVGVALLPWSCRAQNSDTRSADEEDVYALVIRSQMKQWIAESNKSLAEAKDPQDKNIARQLEFEVFFISINGQDPSDRFMERFADLPRIIRKLSSEVPEKGPHVPKDKTTGQTGIVFNVKNLHWHNKDLAELQGGYYCGGLCAAGITFTVERKHGEWSIKSSRMNWIS